MNGLRSYSGCFEHYKHEWVKVIFRVFLGHYKHEWVKVIFRVFWGITSMNGLSSY